MGCPFHLCVAFGDRAILFGQHSFAHYWPFMRGINKKVMRSVDDFCAVSPNKHIPASVYLVIDLSLLLFIFSFSINRPLREIYQYSFTDSCFIELFLYFCCPHPTPTPTNPLQRIYHPFIYVSFIHLPSWFIELLINFSLVNYLFIYIRLFILSHLVMRREKLLRLYYYLFVHVLFVHLPSLLLLIHW